MTDLFELDNFPINPAIIEGAKSGNQLDILNIQLRAFSILDFRVQDAIERLEKKVDCLAGDVKQLKRTTREHTAKIRKLEEKVEEIEKKIA